MLSYNAMVSIAIVLVVLLFVVVFLYPTSSKSKRRRKGRLPEQLPKQKDWQEASLKLERHIYALRKEVDTLERKSRILEDKVSKEKAIGLHFKEKLAQEQGWHDKEQQGLEGKTKEINQLKKDLQMAELNLGEEHSLRLRFEREFKETKRAFDTLNEQRRKLEAENLKINAYAETYMRELNELKRENRELKKKKDDINWVAKSEFSRLEKLLKETEKELERVRRNS